MKFPWRKKPLNKNVITQAPRMQSEYQFEKSWEPFPAKSQRWAEIPEFKTQKTSYQSINQDPWKELIGFKVLVFCLLGSGKFLKRTWFKQIENIASQSLPVWRGSKAYVTLDSVSSWCIYNNCNHKWITLPFFFGIDLSLFKYSNLSGWKFIMNLFPEQ